jgi:predicted dehydrogenase
MASPPEVSRRSFLGQSAAAAAPLFLPRRGAIDTLEVGLIGTGGRCRHLMQALAKVPRVRMAAVCDVWDHHLNLARKLADRRAFVTKDYKEVLARRDLHAVLIATPDHWHVPMTVEACAAGKHIYVEKPLTHKLSEGKLVLQAAAKAKTVIQVGTQQRSMSHIIKARELVQKGRLGRVSKVRLTWNRNTDRVRRFPLGVDPRSVNWKAFLGSAPDQPFNEYRFRNWRWFWDFGGGIFTDLMVHFLDVAHWFLGLRHPLRALAIGNHVVSKDVWQTPDTVQVLLSYPGDIQVHFEGTFANARNGALLEVMGSNATLYVDRGRYEVHPERGRGKYEELVLGTGPRGRDFYDKPDGELDHLTDWVESIRAGRQPSAPVEAGVWGAAAAHLANQSLRSGQVAAWRDV